MQRIGTHQEQQRCIWLELLDGFERLQRVAHAAAVDFQSRGANVVVAAEGQLEHFEAVFGRR